MLSPVSTSAAVQAPGIQGIQECFSAHRPTGSRNCSHGARVPNQAYRLSQADPHQPGICMLKSTCSVPAS
eukprot:15481555-Alexandrium_andersonii.AAC.1